MHSASANAVPSPETAHYATFLFPDWSIYCIVPWLIITQLRALGACCVF